MGSKKEVEEALADWRGAQSRLDDSGQDGDRDALAEDVERQRDEFKHVSAEYMIDRIDALHEAEERRHTATPSTKSFHEAARDEEEIAAEIWNGARQSDQETPRSDA